MNAERNAKGLTALLKIAREHTCALREDLRDIERARATTGGALAEIDIGCDNDAHADERSRRRSRLSSTLISLERAEADVRARLEFASGERDKLERLVQLGVRPEIKRPIGAKDVFRAVEG